VLSRFFPKWRDLSVHESSPGLDIVSRRLSRECRLYVATQWDESVPFGAIHPTKGYRSEDLQRQTFADESFDLVVTQDVFEHIFRPDLAIKEIARTLRPNGAFICTVPIVNGVRASERRASLIEGRIEHRAEPTYHGNPISDKKSLVTIDWGYDIVSYLQHHSGLSFIMLRIDNIDLGIRANLIEVLLGFKRDIPAL
jgi:SAM-dependent methyltransferase